MADTATALAVLKETIADNRPRNAVAAHSTGVRLVNILGSTGWSGTRRALSTAEVLELSAVALCLDVRAQDIAKTTFRMYERLPGNGKREVEAGEHPVAELLATEPNRHHTWYQFHETLLLHLGLIENAYVAKRQTSDGRILELIPVMPARTTILAVRPQDDPINGMGFFAYQVLRQSAHEEIFLAKLPETFLQDEFIHLKGRSFDGLMGYSNLVSGRKTFNMASELLDYSTRLYSGDGQMPGVFQVGKESGDTLSDVAFQRLREQLAEASRKFREEAKPIVLEEGMTFQEIAMNSQQAETAAARDSAIVDCARHFRMPPHKIMHLVNVKYENMETLEKSYVNDSLIPTCKIVEQTMQRSLLNRKDRARYFFEFDRREMLLNDMQKLAEVVKILALSTAITINEARQFFGLNKLEGESGNMRLLPSTYSMIDPKNEVVIPAGAQASGGGDESGDAKPAKPKPKKDFLDA